MDLYSYSSATSVQKSTGWDKNKPFVVHQQIVLKYVPIKLLLLDLSVMHVVQQILKSKNDGAYFLTHPVCFVRIQISSMHSYFM